MLSGHVCCVHSSGADLWSHHGRFVAGLATVKEMLCCCLCGSVWQMPGLACCCASVEALDCELFTFCGSVYCAADRKLYALKCVGDREFLTRAWHSQHVGVRSVADSSLL